MAVEIKKLRIEEEEDVIRPFKCDLCDFHFQTANDLKVHKFFIHGQVPVQCVECSIIFESQKQLRQHTAIHHLEFFRCPHCKKRLSGSKVSMIRFRELYVEHLENCARKPATIKCSALMSTFVDMIQENSRNSVNFYRCSKCNVKFHTKELLHSHTCKGDDGIKAKYPGYFCKICEIAFREELKLMKHINQHHQNELRTPNAKIVVPIQPNVVYSVLSLDNCAKDEKTTDSQLQLNSCNQSTASNMGEDSEKSKSQELVQHFTTSEEKTGSDKTEGTASKSPNNDLTNELSTMNNNKVEKSLIIEKSLLDLNLLPSKSKPLKKAICANSLKRVICAKPLMTHFNAESSKYDSKIPLKTYSKSKPLQYIKPKPMFSWVCEFCQEVFNDSKLSDCHKTNCPKVYTQTGITQPSLLPYGTPNYKLFEETKNKEIALPEKNITVEDSQLLQPVALVAVVDGLEKQLHLGMSNPNKTDKMVSVLKEKNSIKDLPNYDLPVGNLQIANLPSSTKKMFQCKHCKVLYKTESQLSSHIKSHSEFQCHFCDQYFAEEDVLYAHFEKHIPNYIETKTSSKLPKNKFVAEKKTWLSNTKVPYQKPKAVTTNDISHSNKSSIEISNALSELNTIAKKTTTYKFHPYEPSNDTRKPFHLLGEKKGNGQSSAILDAESSSKISSIPTDVGIKQLEKVDLISSSENLSNIQGNILNITTRNTPTRIQPNTTIINITPTLIFKDRNINIMPVLKFKGTIASLSKQNNFKESSLKEIISESSESSPKETISESSLKEIISESSDSSPKEIISESSPKKINSESSPKEIISEISERSPKETISEPIQTVKHRLPLSNVTGLDGWALNGFQKSGVKICKIICGDCYKSCSNLKDFKDHAWLDHKRFLNEPIRIQNITHLPEELMERMNFCSYKPT